MLRYTQISDLHEGRIWAETPNDEVDLFDENGHIPGKFLPRGNHQVWVPTPSTAEKQQ